MKRATIATLLVAVASLAEARVTKRVNVQYETELGWSQKYCRGIDFFAGSEIRDYMAAGRAGISLLKNYAAVWFSQDEVALAGC